MSGNLLGWKHKGDVIAAVIAGQALNDPGTEDVWGTFASEWESTGEAVDFTHPSGVGVTMRVTSYDPGGSDLRRVAVDGGGFAELQIHWPTITVQVWAQCDEDTGDANALAVVSNIFARLQYTGVREILHRAQLSLQGVSPPQPAQLQHDGRAISAWTMDLVFSTVLASTDLSSVGLWIESVAFRSTIDGKTTLGEVTRE